jgi:hypothetical protein
MIYTLSPSASLEGGTELTAATILGAFLKKNNEPCVARYGIRIIVPIRGTRAWMLNFPLFETLPTAWLRTVAAVV